MRVTSRAQMLAPRLPRALALLVFQTLHLAQATASAGASLALLDAERAALMELAQRTRVQGWIHSKGWAGPGSVCSWELVGCDAEGHVKLLTLDFNNLDGELPASIGDLGRLQDLDLEGNSLRGDIPASIGRLSSSLLQLGLGSNKFSGLLPSALCGVPAATVGPACDLSGNNFTCPLPACFGAGTKSHCRPTCKPSETNAPKPGTPGWPS